MYDHKAVSSPFDPCVKLSSEMCPKDAEYKERMAEFPYASVVGNLMYAMTCTRPDIAYAVSVTSRLTSNPGLEHWNAWLRIIKSLAHGS